MGKRRVVHGADLVERKTQFGFVFYPIPYCRTKTKDIKMSGLFNHNGKITCKTCIKIMSKIVCESPL